MHVALQPQQLYRAESSAAVIILRTVTLVPVYITIRQRYKSARDSWRCSRCTLNTVKKYTTGVESIYVMPFIPLGDSFQYEINDNDANAQTTSACSA